MTEVTADTDSQPAYLQDGLADDYEFRHEELSEALHEDKAALYVPDPQNLRVKRTSCPIQGVPDGSCFLRKPQSYDANVRGMENVRYFQPLV